MGAYLTGFSGGRVSCLKNKDFEKRQAVGITMIYKARERPKYQAVFLLCSFD